MRRFRSVVGRAPCRGSDRPAPRGRRSPDATRAAGAPAPRGAARRGGRRRSHHDHHRARRHDRFVGGRVRRHPGRSAGLRAVPARRLPLRRGIARPAGPGTAAGPEPAAAERPAGGAGARGVRHRRLPGRADRGRAARIGRRDQHGDRQPDADRRRPCRRRAGRATDPSRLARHRRRLQRGGDHLAGRRRRPARRSARALAARGSPCEQRLLRLREAAAAPLHGRRDDDLEHLGGDCRGAALRRRAAGADRGGSLDGDRAPWCSWPSGPAWWLT